MIGGLFNALVDIATIPLKVASKIADDVMDTDIEDYVDELKGTIMIKKFKLKN